MLGEVSLVFLYDDSTIVRGTRVRKSDCGTILEVIVCAVYGYEIYVHRRRAVITAHYRPSQLASLKDTNTLSQNNFHTYPPSHYAPLELHFGRF